MDPRLRELVALSALAALACGLAATQDDQLFVAIFGAASLVSIVEAIRRLRWDQRTAPGRARGLCMRADNQFATRAPRWSPSFYYFHGWRRWWLPFHSLPIPSLSALSANSDGDIDMQAPPSLRPGSAAGFLCADAEDANNLPSPSRSHARTLAASRRLDPRLKSWPPKTRTPPERPCRGSRRGPGNPRVSQQFIGFSRGASSAIGALRRSPGTPHPGLFFARGIRARCNREWKY